MRNGWVTKKLSEITTKIGSGATPLGGEASYQANGIALIRSLNVHDRGFSRKNLAFISDSQAAALSNVVVEHGDVLLNITGASIARCCTVPDEILPARVNQHVTIVRPAKSVILPRFLTLRLISPQYKELLLDKGGAGATRQALTKGMLEDLEVPFPACLKEQRRIVGILDEAFEGIAIAKANAEKNLQNARALFDGHLREVFSNRVSSWVDRKLDSICREITVGHVGPMVRQYKQTGIPFLRSQNVRPFKISLENVVFIDDGFHCSLSKSTLRPGDVAIVRTGYPGTAAVIPDGLGEVNCSDLVIVRPGPEVNSHFLAAFFNSSIGKELVLGNIVGAAQKHFNIGAAKQVTLHLPPIAEQLRFVRKFDRHREETERLESIYDKKLVMLDMLKRSLLHQAFTGQL